MPSVHAMTNFIWLMNNNGGRHGDMPNMQKQIAADLGVRPEVVTRMKRNGASMGADQVARLLDGKSFKVAHPEFHDTWLDKPPAEFARDMALLGYGVWDRYQALEALSFEILPPLAQGAVVQEADLVRLLGRGRSRADLGAQIDCDIPVSAEIAFGRRFGVAVQDPPRPLMHAVAGGTATTILLYRSLRAPLYRAVACPAAGVLHLLTTDWEPIRQVPAACSPREPKAQLVLAKPVGHPDPVTYGFDVPALPERIELALVIVGKVVPELRTWSEDGGEGSPERLEHLLGTLAKDFPKIAGRLLIDVVSRPSR